jgi:hypothetical protein
LFIAPKATIDPKLLQPHLIPLKISTLDGMDWPNFQDPHPATVLPNFFIIYFGQQIPQGGISSNEVKVNFSKSGQGYNIWVTPVAEAFKKAEDIDQVLHTASLQEVYNQPQVIKKYFFPTHDNKKSLPFVTSPCGIITTPRYGASLGGPLCDINNLILRLFLYFFYIR